MFENLSVFENRFEELNAKLYDPAVAADPAQYGALMKELKELGPIVEQYRAYQKAESDAAGAESLLNEPGVEKELRQMAAEELDAARRASETASGTSSSRSAAARAARRPRCLPRCCTACTRTMRRKTAGRRRS